MNNPDSNPFETLFSKYLSEQIEELHWNRFQAVCDLPNIFTTERTAFASYFADSIDNNESLYLPKACEAELLLDEIRVDLIGMASGF